MRTKKDSVYALPQNITNAPRSDFNSLFWTAIGVNNRVFSIYDIFSLKKAPSTHTGKYKNIKQDKQALEKTYDRYLKANEPQSSHAFYMVASNEATILEHLLRSVIGKNESYYFYYYQLYNLMSNYRFFTDSFFENEKLIDLLAFQSAYIVQYMQKHGNKVNLFMESLQSQSLMPFITECKRINKIKSDIDLANIMIYTHQQFSQNMQANEVYIPLITANSMKTRLSEWKKNKTLPTLIHQFDILNTLEKGESEQKKAYFIQLLIVRALLHISKNLNDTASIRKFLKRFECFNEQIHILIAQNEDKVKRLQNDYLVDFSLILQDKEEETKESLRHFSDKNL